MDWLNLENDKNEMFIIETLSEIYLYHLLLSF